MTYTKKQFLEDVATEVRALKKHATKEELAELELDNLDANRYNGCIYGRITGDCRNERAAELILACCKRYFKNDERLIKQPKDMTLKNIKKIVNGKSMEGINNAKDLSKSRDWGIEYFSAVESYIITPFAKNANLIAFLKGERKDLVL